MQSPRTRPTFLTATTTSSTQASMGTHEKKQHHPLAASKGLVRPVSPSSLPLKALTRAQAIQKIQEKIISSPITRERLSNNDCENLFEGVTVDGVAMSNRKFKALLREACQDLPSPVYRTARIKGVAAPNPVTPSAGISQPSALASQGAPAADKKCSEGGKRALLMPPGGPRLYEITYSDGLPGIGDSKAARTLSIEGPPILDTEFYAHIMNLQKNRQATGHVRASNDPNAFPRTWSIEKIGQAVNTVLSLNADQPFPVDAKGGIKPTGTVKELTITAVCELQDKSKGGGESVTTAYVCDHTVTSPADVETKEVLAANGILESLRTPELAQIVHNTLEKKNIWSTIGVSELVLAHGTSRLAAGDRKKIGHLRDLLCLGETRHPVHRSKIGAVKEAWHRSQVAPAQAPATR